MYIITKTKIVGLWGQEEWDGKTFPVVTIWQRNYTKCEDNFKIKMLFLMNICTYMSLILTIYPIIKWWILLFQTDHGTSCLFLVFPDRSWQILTDLDRSYWSWQILRDPVMSRKIPTGLRQILRVLKDPDSFFWY